MLCNHAAPRHSEGQRCGVLVTVGGLGPAAFCPPLIREVNHITDLPKTNEWEISNVPFMVLGINIEAPYAM